MFRALKYKLGSQYRNCDFIDWFNLTFNTIFEYNPSVEQRMYFFF